MAKKDAVTTVDEEPRALATAPALDAEDAGAGFEDMGADELAIPFLAILQTNSPQVLEDDSRYVQGAKAGMILNSVTREVYDGKTSGIQFVPIHREQRYIEWRKRDEGGGLVAQHDPDDPFVLDAKKSGPRYGKIDLDSFKGHQGNELAETFNVYGLLVKGESAEPALLSFTSTQIKHYKRWMTRAASITGRDATNHVVRAPLFAHVYRLKTNLEQDTQGNKWYGWAIEFDGAKAEACRLDKDSDLYRMAKELREAIGSGRARAATDSLHNADGATAPDAPTPEQPGTF